jgi:hypothetical protein
VVLARKRSSVEEPAAGRWLSIGAELQMCEFGQEQTKALPRTIRTLASSAA